MKRYSLQGGLHGYVEEDPHGEYYKVTEVDQVLQRQAFAAISGMNAAKAISSHQLQTAHRLRAESAPEALESERSANAILTEENECLRATLREFHRYARNVLDGIGGSTSYVRLRDLVDTYTPSAGASNTDG